ncbi:MAG: hypothetical protein Q3983_00945 [Capnocytophaga sp.]|nr:hypothetical protein [Capnocytophaga sp.]
MTSDEFAKNFYIEKQKYVKAYFQAQPEYPSAVNAKIKAMALPPSEQEKLKEVIDLLLNDVFYGVLLGLDGEYPIGNTQQTYRIYDEEGNLISDCGELEVSAYDYFHGGKYEKEIGIFKEEK